jgi:uncharacterized protein YabE (DUF348 family)
MQKTLAISSLAVLVAVGGVCALTSLHKDVSLTVDGKTRSVSAFALTVGDVLSEAGVVVADADEVLPSPSSPVSDGEEIVVNFEKELTVNLDGEVQVLSTNEHILGDALADIDDLDLGVARVSEPTTTPLGRSGMTVTITTPKQISLAVGGGQPMRLYTKAATVDELLIEQGFPIDADDRVNPAADTAVSEGMKVVVDWVETSNVEKTEAVPFKTETTKNKSLWKGESRVLVEGVEGKAKRVYKVTTVNGKTAEKELLSEKIVKQPTVKKVEQGTKTSPNGVGINLAREAQWVKIAQCESGNNWHINTGNGYYGGLQFSKSSWDANGGRDFAAYPHQATREQQITVANRYYAKAGFKPWSCKP